MVVVVDGRPRWASQTSAQQSSVKSRVSPFIHSSKQTVRVRETRINVMSCDGLYSSKTRVLWNYVVFLACGVHRPFFSFFSFLRAGDMLCSSREVGS